MSLSVISYAWTQSLPPAATAQLPPAALATFGVGDTLLIVVVALIVFGPKKLPEISRQIGKLVFEFRKASNDFKFQIEEELRSAEQAERQKQMQTQAAAPQPATPVAMTAEETVSAEPQQPNPDNATETAGGNETENIILPLTIQPPVTGSPVASERPYGAPVPAPTTEAAAESESPDEMQVNEQDALRMAAAQAGTSDTSATESRSIENRSIEESRAAESHSAESHSPDAVPTHHG